MILVLPHSNLIVTHIGTTKDKKRFLEFTINNRYKTKVVSDELGAGCAILEGVKKLEDLKALSGFPISCIERDLIGLIMRSENENKIKALNYSIRKKFRKAPEK